MLQFDDYLDMEEDFQSNGKRASRKERRELTVRDRSKYKKTNQDHKILQMKRKPPLAINHKRGRILSISSIHITITTKDRHYLCTLKGSLKKEHTKQKNLIAVGDWVHFEENDAHSGVITYIENRSSFLSRSDHFSRRKQHLLAVNIDQVFIVMSVVTPKFKPLLVDRYILSAIKGNMKPIILINKIDLLTHPLKNISENRIAAEKHSLKEFLEAYTPLHYPIVQLSTSTGENLDQLQALMQDKTSVFSGQSGVGKSSLINAILETTLPTGAIAKKTGKGSHTTPSAKVIPLKTGGFCIDTPGIKSFGMYDISLQDLFLAFPDFIPYSLHCKFSHCTHIHETDCAVKRGIATNKIHPLRYNSYTTLFQEILPQL